MDGVMIRMQRRRRRKAAPKNIFGTTSQTSSKAKSASISKPKSPKSRSPRAAPPTAPKKVKRRSPRMKIGGKGRSLREPPSGPISKPTAQEIKIGGKRHWCIDGIFPNFGVEYKDDECLKKFKVTRRNLLPGGDPSTILEREIAFTNRGKENILTVENPPCRLSEDIKLQISGNNSYALLIPIPIILIDNRDIRDIERFPDETDDFCHVSINLEPTILDLVRENRQ